MLQGTVFDIEGFGFQKSVVAHWKNRKLAPYNFCKAVDISTIFRDITNGKRKRETFS